MPVLPFEIPYSITVDANGNGSFVQSFGNDYWYGVVVSGQAQGNPKWNILKNGIFLLPGTGPEVILNGSVCSPGTQLTIKVSQATPNTQVTGLIYGSKAVQPDEALSVHTSAVASISPTVQTSAVGTLIASQANLPGNQNLPFTIGPGTTYLVLEFGPTNSTELQIVGTQSPSTVVYYDEFIGSESAAISQLRRILVDPLVETNLILKNLAGGTVSNVKIIAHTDPPVTFQSLEQVPGSGIIPTRAADLITIPATSVGAGAALVLLLGDIFSTPYLFAYTFSQDSANTASHWILQDSNGNALVPFFDNATRHVFASGNFDGMPGANGSGLKMFNAGANASFLGGALAYALYKG